MGGSLRKRFELLQRVSKMSDRLLFGRCLGCAVSRALPVVGGLSRHRSKRIVPRQRADVALVLQDLIESKGRIGAARARTNLSGMFGWAMREGLCEANPVELTNNPEAGVLSRDRVLSDTELAAVWKACLDDDFGRIVRLLVLTGCRREEIGLLQWNEIDINNRALNISGERIKNHRDLSLILPVLAVDIIRATPRREGHDFLFGGGSHGFSAWSYNMAALRIRLANAGKFLTDWTLHDLRRTFRTGLGRLGVAPHIAELCVNHAKEGIEAVYDKHRYEPEIKAALELWANHVRSVVL
jgi:integrase